MHGLWRLRSTLPGDRNQSGLNILRGLPAQPPSGLFTLELLDVADEAVFNQCRRAYLRYVALDAVIA